MYLDTNWYDHRIRGALHTPDANGIRSNDILSDTLHPLRGPLADLSDPYQRWRKHPMADSDLIERPWESEDDRLITELENIDTGRIKATVSELFSLTAAAQAMGESAHDIATRISGLWQGSAADAARDRYAKVGIAAQSYQEVTAAVIAATDKPISAVESALANIREDVRLIGEGVAQLRKNDQKTLNDQIDYVGPATDRNQLTVEQQTSVNYLNDFGHRYQEVIKLVRERGNRRIALYRKPGLRFIATLREFRVATISIPS